jgi:hypothetical protein
MEVVKPESIDVAEEDMIAELESAVTYNTSAVQSLQLTVWRNAREVGELHDMVAFIGMCVISALMGYMLGRLLRMVLK